MARHDKTSVLARIAEDGIVPVFHHDDSGIVRELAGRLRAGGLSTLEFTNRGDRALSRLGDLLAWADDADPDLIIGVGSVIDPATAANAIDLGANFVFAPTFSRSVAEACNRRNVPYVPGCGTVGEIQQAYEAGVDVVKLFPAGELGGPDFLRAVRAPCPWIRAIPTGGVTAAEESLRAWFGAGATAVGMGSKLIPTSLVSAGDWDGIEANVAAAVAAVAAVRDHDSTNNHRTPETITKGR